MDYSSTSRLTRKPPASQQSDLYSTVLIHDQKNNDSEDQQDTSSSSDIYATMVRKDDDETDDDSLPPLLKRLPKDFGLDPTLNSEADDDDFSVSGTMIVKKSPNSDSKAPTYWDRTGRRNFDNGASYRRRYAEDEDDDEGDGQGDFGTFVVRKGAEEEEDEEEEEMGSGTVVRKTSSTRTRMKSGGGGTMSRAVASMQAVGEIGGGFGGKQRKAGNSVGIVEEGGGDTRIRSGKVSTSSIPDSVTKEDPTTKYELLHELGKPFSKS